MTETRKALRLTVYQRKHPNLTDAEFQKHWSEHHAPMVVRWLSRHGIQGYAQYHTPPETRDLTKAFADAIGGTVSSFDAVVEFIVYSVEELANAAKDPEYLANMRPDEKYMFEWGTAQLTMGWIETYIENGQVKNIVDGKSAFAQA